MKQWQLLADNILKGETTIYNKTEFPKTIEGVGFHEAPRASSPHRVVIEHGTIKNYQAIVPTTWNASPRDTSGTLGPLCSSSTQASLLRNPIADAEHPLEVLRTTRSFGPCMACAVHTVDPSGRNIAKVKVL